MNLSQKRLLNLGMQKKRINPDNLIYKYKTKGRSSKNLRDVDISSKEVSKNKIHFESDLGKIKKGNPKRRSEDQISVIKNVKFFFI